MDINKNVDLCENSISTGCVRETVHVTLVWFHMLLARVLIFSRAESIRESPYQSASVGHFFSSACVWNYYSTDIHSLRM